MKARIRHSGLSLVEEVVIIAAVALLVVFGLPAVRTLFRSLESRGSARAMISAALSSARAIAAKEQHYAGVRFQNRYQEDGRGCQYMIFIINDTEIGPGLPGRLGCRAADGFKLIKLPDLVGVMDLKLGSTSQIVDGDNRIDDDWEIADTTTFSILFSPSGKLVIHELWVRNRDNGSTTSKDDIFNTETNIRDNKIGMFLQDEDNSDIEPSRNSFIIYDRGIFEKVDGDNRWSDYLEGLEVFHINPYTGTMINR